MANTCMLANEVERGFYNVGLFAPCLANLSTLSLPMMCVWASTLRMVVL